ncbi:hypothetical protein N9C30_00975 [bacterium]|nr:hypothetical protein [bacterium]
MATDVKHRFRMTGGLPLGDLPRVMAVPEFAGLVLGPAASDEEEFRHLMDGAQAGVTIHRVSVANAEESEQLAEALQNLGNRAQDITDRYDDHDPSIRVIRMGQKDPVQSGNSVFVTAWALEEPGAIPQSRDDEQRDIAIVFDHEEIEAITIPSELWLRDFLQLWSDGALSLPTVMRFTTDFGPLDPPNRLQMQTGTRFFPVATVDLEQPDLDWMNPKLDYLGLEPREIASHRQQIDELIEMWREDWPGTDMKPLETRLFLDSRDGDRVPLRSTALMRSRAGLQAYILSLYRAVFETLLYLKPHMPFTADFLVDPVDEPVADFWSRDELPVPETNFSVLLTCITVLNAMTSDFGPQVNMFMEGEGGPMEPSLPRLREVLGLQAQAWLASDLAARRCKNETCGQWFAQQEGRAETTSRRQTGVSFCSKSCANSQASRDYRRRRRALKVD